jgi:uncharacterized protein (DUF1697 family)
MSQLCPATSSGPGRDSRLTGTGHNGGMATHVALLRGINVGGRNKVPMADLRELVSSLGHTGVTTYIQSGNVLFTAAGTGTAKMAGVLETAITDRFGIWASVVVLSRDELAGVLDDNPYPDEVNPKLVHVVFLGTEPPAHLLDRINAAQAAGAARGSRDTVTAIGTALFLHTPDGFGHSDLAQKLFRIIGTPSERKKPAVAATARNWASATKLLALCDEKE